MFENYISLSLSQENFLLVEMSNYSEAHICQCLTRLATIRRNSPIIINGNRRKNGLQFVEGVLDLSCGLIKLGLKSGDIVAISALNSDLYLEWLLAIAFVGGITAPLNYRWSLEEATFAMEHVNPILLVTDIGYDNWHSKFQVDSIPSLRWHVLIDRRTRYDHKGNVLTTDMLKKPSPRPQSFNYVSASKGVAIICFTSGTTGRPKGVSLSHSALILQSLAKIAVVGYSVDDVYLHTAPLCHIGGLSSALAMLMVGGCHILVPKFQANLALEAIEQHHVTSFITVPAIISDIISLIRSMDTSKELITVKKILNGGGSLSVELIKDATKIFSRAKLLSAYGMTEACSSLTFMTLYNPTKDTIDNKKFSSVTSVYQTEGICVGKPAPHVELKISIEDSYQVGRILTRGPHLMLGYWGQIPTRESNSKPGDEGWLDTGDIGQIDDHGNLWLIGRMKGRIKSGGENIYPEEVEAVISKHPGVFGVVVVGLPDTRLTEMVVACVQLNNNWTWANFSSEQSAKENDLCLSSETFQQFCKENNLTGFKIPRTFIRWRKQFPMTTGGKLRRDQLRTEVMSHMLFLPSSL